MYLSRKKIGICLCLCLRYTEFLFSFAFLASEGLVGYYWEFTKAVMSNFHILRQTYLLKG